MADRHIIYIENPTTGSHFRVVQGNPKKIRKHHPKKPVNYKDWYLTPEYPGSNKWWVKPIGVTSPQMTLTGPVYPKLDTTLGITGIVWVDWDPLAGITLEEP